MARGRKTGGRRKGKPNKRTAAQKALADAGGEMPLGYLLKILRDTSLPDERRMAAAIAAAPYCHAKLKTLEHTGPDGGPISLASEIVIHCD